MKLLRRSDQSVVVSELKIADNFFDRLCGLIGVKNFNHGKGILFTNTNSIHMWMMSVSIDAVFLKFENKTECKITSIHSGLRPWKLIPVLDMQANGVLELPKDSVRLNQLRVGEVLCTVS